MKKYQLITYGCQANKSDSERITSWLEQSGYRPTERAADLVIINVCSIRQSAVDRVYGQINALRTSGTKIALTGCLLKSDLKKMKEKVDFILDIKQLSKWPQILGSSSKEQVLTDYFKIPPKSPVPFSSLVPIISGCNNFCTYCVVPYTRGPEYSRPLEEIMTEIKEAILKGVKEIWLLGQNVNSYQNKNCNFEQLLEKVENLPGDFWIRFLSSHPKEITPQFIKRLKESKKITKYLNLPVQSGDDQVLKRMNRPYTSSEYEKSILKIVKEIPTLSLSTDVIVGFPGEDKKAFQNTCQLFKKIKFDMAYVSKYSPRPGTASFKFKDDVSKIEKERRFRFLTAILEKTAFQKNKKIVGQEVRVLVQKRSGPNLIGKTEGYKTVKFAGSEQLIGTFVKVKIEKALIWGLKGKLK